MTPISSITDPRERLLAFAREREAIRIRRMRGWPGGLPDGWEGPVPGYEVWTLDPILAMYRFCNVYRQLDRVTLWIHRYWMSPNADDEDVWFSLVVARFVNLTETLGLIGYPVPWRPKHFLKVMAELRRQGRKAYTSAYMVRASDVPGESKAEYQERDVFTPMWKKRGQLRPKAGDTLNSYHMLLGQWHGLGSFMSGQVLADLKWVEPLRSASDWETFSCSGPGSRRGLNRILGRPVNSPWTEEEWRLEAARQREWFNERWEHAPVDGMNFNNVLCEGDKYFRVMLGEGRPRARFP